MVQQEDDVKMNKNVMEYDAAWHTEAFKYLQEKAVQDPGQVKQSLDIGRMVAQDFDAIRNGKLKHGNIGNLDVTDHELRQFYPIIPNSFFSIYPMESRCCS
jgi:hypothetical protein